MQHVLVTLGFQPRCEKAAEGKVAYRLCNCPYREAALDNPQLICTLHRGITRGLLDVIEPHTALTGFVPKDARAAGCRIELHGPPAG
jgi:predicted ArsR family transcriptional regulator